MNVLAAQATELVRLPNNMIGGQEQGEQNLVIRFCRKKYSCFIMLFLTIIITMDALKIFLDKNYDSFLLNSFINIKYDRNESLSRNETPHILQK